jgi:phage shock protein PspC (stress-responsive transcriptional regulator)
MFLLFYYIISVISTFILLSYILYKEEKYWNEVVSIYDIDISIIGILVALSVFFGFLLFPYIIIRFIIEKIKGRI